MYIYIYYRVCIYIYIYYCITYILIIILDIIDNNYSRLLSLVLTIMHSFQMTLMMISVKHPNSKLKVEDAQCTMCKIT